MTTPAPTPLARNAVRLTAALILLTTAACADQRTTQTGFLPDYARMTVVPRDADTLFWVAPDAGSRRFTGFYIDQVIYKPGPKAPVDADAATIDHLRGHYRRALVTAFAAHFPEVSGPGPGVLRVSAAITGFERANAALNAVTSLVLGPVTAGGASTEAEVVDSGDGARMAALATHSNGHPFLGGPHNYFLQYGHARRAVTRHAEALGDLVASAPR